ncbi:hypothetical protein HanRHA438_Chr00c36g0856221 [Helianthus annuus]|nr:hypothetical protein HanRHA438_Chr00c36g0856221 [Helianthus annuus]
MRYEWSPWLEPDGFGFKGRCQSGSKQKMRRFNRTGEDCQKTSGTENVSPETFQVLRRFT